MVDQKFGSKTRGKSDARHNNREVDPRAPPMFDSCRGGARGSSGKNNNAKNNNNEDDDAFVTEDIDEQTDGISLGNGWQRWVDFEERRYYYSKGGDHVGRADGRRNERRGHQELIKNSLRTKRGA